MADPYYDELYYGGKEDKAVRIDYSVLSVGVMTLGLILIVEVARHKLDHHVEHSVFYKAVLEGVYSELATLGIVEFLLHVMAEYYEEYDKAKKQVFADVHFLLFYTAILNAIGTLVLSNVVKRISHKLWVTTEELDVGHYVELREEFDAVRNKLDKLRNRRNGARQSSDNGSDDTESPNGFTADDCSEDDFEFSAAGLAGAIQNISDRIRYPALKAKYRELLVQVRFHELRVHFLQAYHLPLKFQISDYLMRSEQHVLMKLINVSPIAWLLLTGVVNLLYYVLGIVSYKIRNTELVGVTMIYLFYISIYLFVVLSWVVRSKMNYVYKQIMNSDTLWDVNAEDTSERKDLAAEQKGLFWAGDPKLVIAAIQFMQFGYAVAISTVIIFWEEINDGPTPMAIYVFAVFGCYALFIGVTAHIIPRYTLCTNLAQLVDEQRLHEAVASFRLQEAQHREMERTETQYQKFLDSDSSIVSGVPSIGSSTKPGSSIGGGSSVGNRVSAELMRDMVKSDTSALRVILPDSVKNSMDRSKPRTKNRVKQFSDGVSAMTRQKVLSAIPQHAVDDESVSLSSNTDTKGVPMQRIAPSRRKARSEGVSFMANAEQFLISELPKTNGFDDVDDVRIESDSSGHSDVNDIPLPSANKEVEDVQKSRISMKQRLYTYFTSRRFIVVSNVFGTMVVFFFIGQRVESFFLSEGIGSSRFVHFDFAHDFVFWLLFTWLGFFQVKSCLVFYAFGFRRLVSRKERTIVLATVMDFIFTTTCMFLFLYAETLRCCNPEDIDSAFEDSEIQKSAPCACPAFGSRQYGGLGKVEPWISLIALRIFRHWFAKRIVLAFEPNKRAVDSDEFMRQQSQRLNPFDVFTESHRPDDHEKTSDNHGKSHNHDNHHRGGDFRGTAAELWESAIGKYPDLVAKHGEFSAEVLRAMLGLDPNNSDEVDAEALESSPKNNGTSATEKNFAVKKSLARLSVDAQRIIASGTLGGDVVEVQTKNANGQPHRPQFKLCRMSRQSSELSMFVAPNATLIRSMRRCDKKFLPFLDRWTVVDVVVTRFEMVYFAADTVDSCDLETSAAAAREALMATKGGKGCLRLCDVALGRRVVGSMKLTDAVSVHVDRSTHEDEFQIENANVEVENTEFWKPIHKGQKDDSANNPRGQRWAKVFQDELRLRTNHGETVYLRFYSDLEDATNNPGLYTNDDYDNGQMAKNNALHWAQTIGRICGTDQLKQSLPHFGQGGAQEIRDYLVVHAHSKKPSSLFSAFKDLGDQVEI